MILVKNSSWDAKNNGQSMKAPSMSIKELEVQVRKAFMAVMAVMAVMATMKH